MKFNARTIQILRSFAMINQSLIFKPGSQIKTISSSRTIMARATIETEIESTFGIYDLPQFLSAVSMFDEPELIPGTQSIRITNGNEKLDFRFAEISLIQSPPEKDIVLQSVDVEFELKNEVLNRTLKALGIIGAPEIAVTGDGEKIYLETLNTKNSSESAYRVEVGTTDKEFRMIFLAENIKLLPGDYSVAISAKGLSHFKSDDVEYWVAVEASSHYTG